MTKKAKPRGLGRGLNALFEDDEELVSILSDDGEVALGGAPTAQSNADSASDVEMPTKIGLQRLGIEQLEPGVSQPRMDFDEDALQTLAKSIEAHGILQPLLVRQKRDVVTDEIIPDRYEIIAGERRWRAAQKAQLHEVPVVIRELEDEQAMQIALIENLQREDLNPVEEALAYQRLIQDHNYTQNQLAEALGRSRSHIANMTRMLTLPEPVLDLVRNGDLSAGHVRSLITFDEPLPLAEKIMAEGMSVRAVERYVSALNDAGKAADGAKTGAGKTKQVSFTVKEKDADLLALEKELSDQLGMAVTLDMQGGSHSDGTVRIAFKGLSQLDHLIALMKGNAVSARVQEDDAPMKLRD